MFGKEITISDFNLNTNIAEFIHGLLFCNKPEMFTQTGNQFIADLKKFPWRTYNGINVEVKCVIRVLVNNEEICSRSINLNKRNLNKIQRQKKNVVDTVKLSTLSNHIMDFEKVLDAMEFKSEMKC